MPRLLRVNLTPFLEVLCNRNRCHSHLGGISPEAFEQAAA